MDTALTFDEGLICRTESPEGLLSFLASRLKSAPRSLTPSAADVLRGCGDAVNQILRTTIDTRNRAEFNRVFEEVFPKYCGLALAISHFSVAVIQRSVREQLVRESICEMESDFRDKGLAAFGSLVCDQAIFTVWTLRKISELTMQIIATPVSPARKEDDREYCSNFNFNALRAQFCLDCLSMALDDRQPIYPEVLEELVDGLRAMVNAYTWARRGLEIRVPSEAPTFPFQIPPVEDEDVALMDLSFSTTSDWLDGERGTDAAE